MTAQKLVCKIVREMVRPIKQLCNLPKKLYNLYKDIRQYRAFTNAPLKAFRGKFNTFKEAMNSQPKNNKNGFYETLTPNYDSFLAQIKSQKIDNREYPVFFWLDMIAKSKNNTTPLRVLDFGGGCGWHYFSFMNTIKILNPYQFHTENLKWQVVEIPKEVELGNKIVKTLHIDNLSFTTSLAKTNPHNCLIASGVLMYIENLFDFLKEYLYNGGGGAYYSSSTIPSKTSGYFRNASKCV